MIIVDLQNSSINCRVEFLWEQTKRYPKMTSLYCNFYYGLTNLVISYHKLMI